MLTISISDKSIEALKISRNLLQKRFVSSFFRREFPDGFEKDKLTEVIKEIANPDKKCALALSDSKILTFRFKVPLGISSDALETTIVAKAKELLPDNIEDLVYDYKIKDSQVLLLAIPYETLADYLAIFKSLNVNPIFVTSESQASWETFGQTIIKGEVVMFADIGEEACKFSFFDQSGPVLTLKREVGTKNLEKEAQKARISFWQKQGEMVQRVILANANTKESPRNDERNGKTFFKTLGIWETDLNKLLKTKLKDLGVKYNSANLPLAAFTKAIGLSLLVEKKDSLNLLKRWGSFSKRG